MAADDFSCSVSFVAADYAASIWLLFVHMMWPF